MEEINKLIGMIKNFDPNKQDEKYFLLEKAKEVRTNVELMENELKSLHKGAVAPVLNDHDNWSNEKRNK